jgi:hypothetical protein
MSWQKDRMASEAEGEGGNLRGEYFFACVYSRQREVGGEETHLKTDFFRMATTLPITSGLQGSEMKQR